VQCYGVQRLVSMFHGYQAFLFITFKTKDHQSAVFCLPEQELQLYTDDIAAENSFIHYGTSSIVVTVSGNGFTIDLALIETSIDISVIRIIRI
jgi:hypothetical protein